MWNTTGAPPKVVLFVLGFTLLKSQLGSLQVWRWLDDATTPGREHAGPTKAEAPDWR